MSSEYVASAVNTLGGPFGGDWNLLRGSASNRGNPLGLALDLDFATTKALDARITFTRASSGTYIDSSGALQTATTNTPRFTHDPSTLQSLGLLIEDSRTNILLNSATLSTQTVTVTATPYTLSFTGTGTVTLTGVSTAGPLVGTGTGEANRVSLTFTPTAGALIVTVTGTVTNAQLEAGSFRTSYIATTGTSATRSADVATMTSTNFSSWFNATEGTFVSSAFVANAATATLLTVDDGSLNNRMYIQGETSSLARGTVVTSGSTVSNLSASSTRSVIAAMSYKLNNFAFSASNATPSTDTSGTLPVVDRMRIGAAPISGFNTNGPIARIRFYRRALPVAVQMLSAL